MARRRKVQVVEQMLGGAGLRCEDEGKSSRLDPKPLARSGIASVGHGLRAWRAPRSPFQRTSLSGRRRNGRPDRSVLSRQSSKRKQTLFPPSAREEIRVRPGTPHGDRAVGSAGSESLGNEAGRSGDGRVRMRWEQQTREGVSGSGREQVEESRHVSIEKKMNQPLETELILINATRPSLRPRPSLSPALLRHPRLETAGEVLVLAGEVGVDA